MLRSCPQCEKPLNPPLESINRQVCYHCGWSGEVVISESKKIDQSLNQSKETLFKKSSNRLYTGLIDTIKLIQSREISEQKWSNRLYTGLIDAIKLIQYLGCLAGIIVFPISFYQDEPAFWFCIGISIIISSFVSTQWMIAVVDLLSRIEENVRKLNSSIDGDRPT